MKTDHAPPAQPVNLAELRDPDFSDGLTPSQHIDVLRGGRDPRAAAASWPGFSTLPAHIRRCPGDGSFEDGQQHWREGCDDCMRRIAPGGRDWMDPPPIIAFECECRISPGDLPSALPS